MKHGWLKGGECYVVKIASDLQENPSMCLPSSSILMLLFSESLGEPVCLLLDEARRTDVGIELAPHRPSA